MIDYDGMQWYDWVRSVQSLIALAALYSLGRNWLSRRADYSKRLRDFWWVMSAAMFVFCVGPIEQIIRGREESWTLFISLFVSVICLKASMNKERTLLKSDED